MKLEQTAGKLFVTLIAEPDGSLTSGPGIDTPLRLALDTGAAASLLTPDAAARIRAIRDPGSSVTVEGIGGQQSQLGLVRITRLRLGNIRLDGLGVAVAAFAPGAGGREAADGLLGVDVLRGYEVEIDLPAGQLALWQASDCADGEAPRPAWPAVTLPATRAADGRLSVPLAIGDVQTALLLDTGADALVLSRALAARAGFDQADAPGVSAYGVNARAAFAQPWRVPVLDFAQKRWRGVVAAVVANPRLADTPGLIGLTPLLAGRRLWLSFATARVYLSP